MEELLFFIETNQGWFYIFMFLLGAFYAQSAWKSYLDFRRAIFGLERERAASRLRRIGAIMALIMMGLLVVFLLSTFVAPAVPVAPVETPIATISVLTQSAEEDSGQLATAVPIEAGVQACENPNATITSPENGVSIGGVVQIEGAANLEGFVPVKSR
jgi:hypothetical protein